MFVVNSLTPKSGADEDANEDLANLPERLPPGDEESNLERMLELVPEDKREEFITILTQEVRHSGPLPRPDDLARYEQILPGLAERIVRLPEREQEHRHRVVERAVERDYEIRRCGQRYALVGMAILIAFATLLAILGDSAWAARVAIGTVVATVGIFVTGKFADYQSERTKDADDGEA